MFAEVYIIISKHNILEIARLLFLLLPKQLGYITDVFRKQEKNKRLF